MNLFKPVNLPENYPKPEIFGPMGLPTPVFGANTKSPELEKS